MLISFTMTTMVGALAACGGSSGTATSTSTALPDSAIPFLSGTTDVPRILAQAVQEAKARKLQATIAVVDRVGNVLAVYRMGPAAASTPNPVLIASTPTNDNPSFLGGLEGIELPMPGPLAAAHLDDQAAIAKAVSGAYLSTAGHAFSTRTASQIIDSHFNPGEAGQPAGPLFGVQFSSLACSDFTGHFANPAAPPPLAGPHSSPLGLSADPGGFPLYDEKTGLVVGGVGVIADGQYTIDNSTTLDEVSDDEAIAYAATYGYSAPKAIHADHITVGGRTLRYSNIAGADSNAYSSLAANPANAPALDLTNVSIGALVNSPGYFTAGTLRDGTSFDVAGSGIRADSELAHPVFPGQDAFVFVQSGNTGAARYPPSAGMDSATLGGKALAAADVQQVLSSALAVASKTRAQIRIPLGDTARVTISVVDTQGNILGMVASRDAPVFGADVSIQKARSAALLSSTDAGSYLTGLPDAQYLSTLSPAGIAAIQFHSQPIGQHVTIFQGFLTDPAPLADGIAYSARAIGDLARPFYPDGIDGMPPGPLSVPSGAPWSPFDTGLQLDLSINAILQHVLFVAGAPVPDVAPGCNGVTLATNLSVSRTLPSTDMRIGNGLQIFAGGVPIYRGSTLVGAIGVSGDGTQQDDLIAFLGLAEGSAALAMTEAQPPGNAPPAMRADTLAPKAVRLQYVQCPSNPFVNSNTQDACDGL
jgi:uncharacterized protein GlcG (DUF336 family)